MAVAVVVATIWGLLSLACACVLGRSVRLRDRVPASSWTEDVEEYLWAQAQARAATQGQGFPADR